MKIALLGKIPKGDSVRESFLDWKIEYQERILEKISSASFLNGDLIKDDQGPELCVGHDLWIIRQADVVIVDAQEKIGAGTAQEMVFAKLWKKPLVSVVPRDSHHRRSSVVFDGNVVSDWIHPFLFVASDYIADSIDATVDWLVKYSSGQTNPIKGIDTFENCVIKFENGLSDIVSEYKEKGW